MKRPLLYRILSVIGMMAVVAAIDWVTGWEASCFPLYFIPIALAYFEFGKVTGYVMCFIAIGVYLTVDYIDGHHYTHEIMRYQTGLSRLIVCLLLVYGLNTYSRTVAVHRRRLEQLRKLIPVCAWCGRVLGPDGQWHALDDLLTVSQNKTTTECPRCTVDGKKEKGEI